VPPDKVGLGVMVIVLVLVVVPVVVPAPNVVLPIVHKPTSLPEPPVYVAVKVIVSVSQKLLLTLLVFTSDITIGLCTVIGIVVEIST